MLSSERSPGRQHQPTTHEHTIAQPINNATPTPSFQRSHTRQQTSQPPTTITILYKEETRRLKRSGELTKNRGGGGVDRPSANDTHATFKRKATKQKKKAEQDNENLNIQKKRGAFSESSGGKCRGTTNRGTADSSPLFTLAIFFSQTPSPPQQRLPHLPPPPTPPLSLLPHHHAG